MYTINTVNNANPSPRVMILFSVPFNALSNMKNINNNVAIIENKKSFVITCLFAFKPAIKALIPNTPKRLNKLDPITLLIAISFEAPFLQQRIQAGFGIIGRLMNT